MTQRPLQKPSLVVTANRSNSLFAWRSLFARTPLASYGAIAPRFPGCVGLHPLMHG
jgi:hypothetical protein